MDFICSLSWFELFFFVLVVLSSGDMMVAGLSYSYTESPQPHSPISTMDHITTSSHLGRIRLSQAGAFREERDIPTTGHLVLSS